MGAHNSKESHGLGLNICKKIAKSLGGDLILNYDYNKGSEFILTMTLKQQFENEGFSKGGSPNVKNKK